MKSVIPLTFHLVCWILCAHSRLAQASIPGDGNNDYVVDSQDVLILEQNWHKDALSGNRITVDLPAPSIRLVRIPAGSFMMGSPDTERSRNANEGPVHQVTIGYEFYLGETEVTQAQWRAIVGSIPGNINTDDPNMPVAYVSWDDCQAFLATLNALNQGTFRLPSEAEWEYACRAGTTKRFYFGNSLGCNDECADCEVEEIVIGRNQPLLERNDDGFNLNATKILPFFFNRSDFMWYCGNAGLFGEPVRTRKPNGFGLYDMAGNVQEWCQDSYHADYTGAPNDGSAWELNGENQRVTRGGDFLNHAKFCRSASRIKNDPTTRFGNGGFRVAWTP
jgi:formylglycine-generating enzyme required for sulfatase activity